MKKWSIALFTLMAPLTSVAQEPGMHFEHHTTWEKVLAKAKAENKYIFVDCYTTWCGPCKVMSKNVFPLETVGKFYNEHYINVKVQLDTTAGDNEEVKSWFATGDMLEEKYNVHAYPTYLFFDPNGTIVHRAVGSSDAETFIRKGNEAINPEKQYYALKRQYEGGQKDEAFLYKLAKAANDSYDRPFATQITKEYIATQKDLLKKENIELLADDINSSKDIGFTELLNNPEAFDKVLGYSYASNRIRTIILREEAMPFLFPKGQPETQNPDWNGALQKVKSKYPTLAEEAIAYYKITYYQRKKDWSNFGPAVSEYMKLYGSNVSPAQMNQFAWTVFENCNDMTCVTNALEWSKKSFAQNNSHMFMDTYANLLYKAGKKDEAIKWETNALNLAKKNNEDTGDYETALEKMKKGEPTW